MSPSFNLLIPVDAFNCTYGIDTQAELVAIDEAAAIPLPTVKKLMGPYLVFMSSTGRTQIIPLRLHFRRTSHSIFETVNYLSVYCVASSYSHRTEH